MEFVIQYLEPGPEVVALRPLEVRERLRTALATLPISRVVLGWGLPERLVEACAEETRRAGARLMRWQPLLCDDGTLPADASWRTIGLDGTRVPGVHNLPEFTFLCPNKPAVREAILGRVDELIRSRQYQGIFLDRIRFPSPAADPAQFLACFCEDCERAAAELRFDLPAAREQIRGLVATSDQAVSFVKLLLDNHLSVAGKPELVALDSFMDFRMLSITRIVQAAADLIRGAGLEVGLDCFAPSLARMVGQDYEALDVHADWIKAMLYCHTLGPAGMPYELLALAGWLTERHQINEWTALMALSEAARMPFPPTRSTLIKQGISDEALGMEVWRARATGVRTLLAGIELVQIPGIAELTDAQLTVDLTAVKMTNPQGIVLSWDLLHIPQARLQLVRRLLVN